MPRKSFQRTAHGKGADAIVRIEFPPPDELSAPVADPRPPITGVERRPDGTISGTEAARVLGSRGGQVRATRIALARSLGLPADTSSKEFAPYRRSAAAFRRHHCAELAKMAGGVCGSGPSSMVASAALQLAASRFLFDQGAITGDAKTLKAASQLANDSRLSLAAAYELAVREAEALGKSNVNPLHAAILTAGESK